MISLDRRPIFELGEIEMTPAVGVQIPPDEIESALRRHARGDWGEMDASDKAANDKAVKAGGTVASIFQTANGSKFYVITEPDRSVTTVLLPVEY
jgi:hypothetical protein